MLFPGIIPHKTITCCIPQSDLKCRYGDQPAEFKWVQVSRAMCRPGIRGLEQENPPRRVLEQALTQKGDMQGMETWSCPCVHGSLKLCEWSGCRYAPSSQLRLGVGWGERGSRAVVWGTQTDAKQEWQPSLLCPHYFWTVVILMAHGIHS